MYYSRSLPLLLVFSLLSYDEESLVKVKVKVNVDLYSALS